jgi:aryl-alcohol dehydrogenase-like predicted oxidoreductase
MDHLVKRTRLALGSVQWGMSYGIANRSGVPTRDEVQRLLQRAEKAGVLTIDTARAYGASEQVIGSLIGPDPAWTIITKLAAELPTGSPTVEELSRWTRDSLDQSRQSLRRPRLDVVLLHRAVHRTLGDGVIWKELVRQKEAGTVGSLGVSVGSPCEAEELVANPDIVVVQVAANLLDQRLVRTRLLQRLQDAGKAVFVRSIFLQGVAHLGWKDLPERLRNHASSLRNPLEKIEEWCAARALTLAEGFLTFGHSLDGTTIVIGCETADQWVANEEAWERTRSLKEEMRTFAQTVPELSEAVLNPACWPA